VRKLGRSGGRSHDRMEHRLSRWFEGLSRSACAFFVVCFLFLFFFLLLLLFLFPFYFFFSLCPFSAPLRCSFSASIVSGPFRPLLPLSETLLLRASH
jgi:hypothetical protein